MPGDQWGDQRKQGIEVGRQIDVHVGNDPGLTLEPGLPHGAPPALLLEVDDANPTEVQRQSPSNFEGLVGAAVIGDRDPGGERKALIEIAAQPPHALFQVALLVVDRDHDVDNHGQDATAGAWIAWRSSHPENRRTTLTRATNSAAGIQASR